MARYLFGAATSDWLVRIDQVTQQVLIDDRPLTLWSLEVGGDRYTDLLDRHGQPTDTIRSTGGQYRFQGPDGVRFAWIDGGAGRELIFGVQFWEELVNGGLKPSTVGIDDDGVPFFASGGISGTAATVLADIDGVPYYEPTI